MKKVIQGISLLLISNTQKIYDDSPFLPERMGIEKVEKLLANLHDKIEYFIHIRNLK